MDIETITVQVTNAPSVTASASLLMGAIIERLDEAGTDAAMLRALRADLARNYVMLATAVAHVPGVTPDVAPVDVAPEPVDVPPESPSEPVEPVPEPAPMQNVPEDHG